MRRFLGPLALTAGSILLALLLVEAGLRLSAGGSHATQGQIYDQRPGYWTRMPHARDTVRNEDDRIIQLDCDANGLRNPPGAFENATVWLLGDSYIMADNTPEEETLAARLRQAGFPVYNAGVDGFSTCNALALLESLLDKGAPRLAILCFYLGNDFKDNYFCVPPAEPESPPDASPGEAAPARTPSLWRRGLADAVSLARRSRLLTLAHDKVYLPHVRGMRDDPMASYCLSELRALRTKPDEAVLKAVDHTRRLLRAMRDRLRDRGAELLLAGIPSKAQAVRSVMEISACVRDPRFETEALAAVRAGVSFDMPDQQLRGLADELGIAHVSLLETFRARPGHELYFQLDRHWRAEGQRLAAQEIARRLELTPDLRP